MGNILTPEQEAAAKSWLHDLFVVGADFAFKKPCGKDDYWGFGGHYYPPAWAAAAAKDICNTIINCVSEPTDPQKLQEISQYLSQMATEWRCKFSPTMTDTRHVMKKPASMLLKYIVWFCKTHGIIWSTRGLTEDQINSIKDTELGGLLWKHECFDIQQHKAKAVSLDQRSGSAGQGVKASSTRTRQPATAGGGSGRTGAPVNGFKSAGALSDKAFDLKGNPHDKIFITGPIFCINGLDSNGTTLEQTLFVRPVDHIDKNGTNKVFCGSAKGYGYCQVFFDNVTDADTYLVNATQAAQNGSLKIPSTIAKLEVQKKSKALSNGYFKVGSEFGDVLISASKLNESIEEDLTEAAEEPKGLTISISDYSEALNKTI